MHNVADGEIAKKKEKKKKNPIILSTFCMLISNNYKIINFYTLFEKKQSTDRIIYIYIFFTT